MSLLEPLEPLASYLYNPHSSGVYYARLSISSEAFAKLQEKMLGARIRPRSPAEVRLTLGKLLLRTKEKLLEQEEMNKDQLELLKPVFEWSQFINRDRIALPIDKYTGSSTLGRVLVRRIRHNIFGPHIPLSGDALHIAERRHDGVLVVEVSSLETNSIEKFISFVKELPEIGHSCKVVSRDRQHSSRIVLDLVPAATSSWTQLPTTAERVPQFILSYLEAAFDNVQKGEWRTSIVLSAIGLESLLAEIDENEFREIAPDILLGALREAIEKKSKLAGRAEPFPRDILEAINKCNDSRISAVHRGGRQLSDREAHEALMGPVRFSIWYNFLRSPSGTPSERLTGALAT